MKPDKDEQAELDDLAISLDGIQDTIERARKNREGIDLIYPWLMKAAEGWFRFRIQKEQLHKGGR